MKKTNSLYHSKRSESQSKSILTKFQKHYLSTHKEKMGKIDFIENVNLKQNTISEIQAEKQMEIASKINHSIRNFCLETNNKDVYEAYLKMTKNKVVTIISKF